MALYLSAFMLTTAITTSCSKWSMRTASTERSTTNQGGAGDYHAGNPASRVINRIRPMSVSASFDASPRDVKPLYVVAWLMCAIFYLYQYATRSAPGVMQGLLSTAWGGNHIGSMIAGYYVAYALTALAAGFLLDRYGASRILPFATALVAAGCLIFAQGSETAGMVGFVLQAIGAVFAFIGSSYVAARYLPARTYAMFMGLTQCLGMLGAALGSKPVQMAVDPAGAYEVSWQH